MRKLGEQWIEEIDGKMHMLKLVKGNPASAKRCSGCAFNNEHKKLCELPGGVFHISEIGCARQFLIIKDLGVLNEDGCLPCPFCGEYPFVLEEEMIGYGGKEYTKYFYSHKCMNGTRIVTYEFDTIQEAIDTWNRRA